jgi:hypothetical protein
MVTVIKDIDFDCITEKLLVKSLAAWIKTRFMTVMEYKYPEEAQNIVKEINAIDEMKKTAWISESDAWIIEKNQLLFNKVLTSYLKETLSEELFNKYGNIQIEATRSSSIINVSMLPISFDPKSFKDAIIPCSLVVFSMEDILTTYKNHDDKLVRKSSVDIIPLTKMYIDSLLTSADHKIIDKFYTKYHKNLDCVSSKEKIEARKRMEKENLDKIIDTISNSGDNLLNVKFIITVYTQVKEMYKTNPHLITMIRFERHGIEPVLDFSFGVKISTEARKNLNMSLIYSVLSEMFSSSDIKVKISNTEDVLLFTTNDKKLPVPSETNIVILSQSDVDYIFKSNTVSKAKVEDCRKIMEKVFLSLASSNK